MTKSRFAVLIITKKAFNRFLAVTKETSTGEIIFTILQNRRRIKRIWEPSQAGTRRPETDDSRGTKRKEDCKKQRGISN